MKNKIVIIILGNRNAGKSSTLYELFKRNVKSGYKNLTIDQEKIEVFVKNTSFEETGQQIGDKIFIKNTSFEETGQNAEDFFEKKELPQIILCAVQYKEDGKNTINYFVNNGYYLYIQWLNPGYKDTSEYEDYLSFEEQFSQFGEFHKTSGKEKKKRAESIKEFLINQIHTSNSI